MLKLILELSKIFHINPYGFFGFLCLMYTFFGFAKRNKESHDFKDKEIDRLRKRNLDLSNELAMFKSLKRQSEMIYKK
mgnify:CR=1 FL=1